jgi:hypothetical protein
MRDYTLLEILGAHFAEQKELVFPTGMEYL